jgi:hypothetical protein
MRTNPAIYADFLMFAGFAPTGLKSTKIRPKMQNGLGTLSTHGLMR